MTKEQVAQYLGISERSVIRYAARGLLKVKYAGQERGGKIAIYDPDDVEGLKLQLDVERLKPRGTGEGQGALAVRDKAEIAPVIENLKAGLIEGIAEALSGGRVPLADKLTLSLAEAAKLSGLPRRVLVEAIKAEKLRGSRDWGRGWRVRRADLEAFVESL